MLSFKRIIQLRQVLFYYFTVSQFLKGRIRGLVFSYMRNKSDGSPMGRGFGAVSLEDTDPECKPHFCGYCTFWSNLACPEFRNQKADGALLPRREHFKIKLRKSCACSSLQLLRQPINTSALQERELPVLTQGRTSTATPPV